MSALVERPALGQPRTPQKSEEYDVAGRIDRIRGQLPAQVRVSHATVPGNHPLVHVPDLENHNHHLWLNIRRSVQPKALHHPEERIVGYVAIF